MSRQELVDAGADLAVETLAETSMLIEWIKQVTVRAV